MEKPIGFRLSEECQSKLAYEAEKAGMTKTAYLTKLIMHGEVNVLHNGKKLIEIVAKVHDGINQNAMSVRKDLSKIRKEIIELKNECHNKNSALIEPLVIRANAVIDRIEENYNIEVERTEKRLEKSVDF